MDKRQIDKEIANNKQNSREIKENKRKLENDIEEKIAESKYFM